MNVVDAGAAVAGFLELSISRYPADWLRPRMWALRHNLSAYDATYVGLAEMTAATSLLTTDARLANAPGSAARSGCCDASRRTPRELRVDNHPPRVQDRANHEGRPHGPQVHRLPRCSERDELHC